MTVKQTSMERQQELRDLFQELKRTPLPEDTTMFNPHTVITPSYWEEVLLNSGIISRNRKDPKDTLLAEIRRANPSNVEEFKFLIDTPLYFFVNRFGSISRAMEEAGINNGSENTIPTDNVVTDYERLKNNFTFVSPTVVNNFGKYHLEVHRGITL